MTQLLCKTPSVRFKDGREVDYNYIVNMGLPGIVELAGSSLLPGVSEEEKQNLLALPHTAGDDAQDVMLGAYNVAKNIELLKSNNLSTITDVPAIVIGSGPSLTEYLPKIKEEYGKYLLVASASAVRPLIEAGIEPHVIAPKERTRYPLWCFDICPDTALYAGLLVVPDLHNKFKTGWCVGDSGQISQWADVSYPIAPGPSSGTHAMSVALSLTTGPIFLIGMDNCGGHFNGYKGIEQRVDDSAMCYDGITRESKWIYRVARTNMMYKHDNRTYQLSPEAAIVDGVPLGKLTGGRRFNACFTPFTNQKRYDRMKHVLKRLPEDWDSLYGFTQTVTSIEDTRLSRLNSPNSLLFHAILAPTVVQLSMERRLGMSDKDVIQWYKEATHNIIETLTDTINEMTTIGGHYV